MTRHIWTIAANDARLLRRDPLPYLLMTVMPLLLMEFLKPAYRLMFEATGARHANGSEQVVPGMAITFGSLLVANMGFGYFREHGWDTWDRLQVSGARAADLLFGKLAVPWLVLLLQQAVLFGLGVAVLGLRVRGPARALALALTILALTLFLSALAAALVSITRTVMRFNTVASLLAFVLAGIGGALAPIGVLPGWAQAAAKVTPTYWVMKAFRLVLLDSAGPGTGVFGSLLVVMAFTVALGLAAMIRFRAGEAKVAWA